MSTLRFIFADQLSRCLSALDGIDLRTDIILMVEVANETTYVPHHKQKIAFLLSAMRHFARELREEGCRVDYVELTEPGNTGHFTGELIRAIERHQVDRVIVTEPGEWRVLDMIRSWESLIDIPVELREDDRFFSTRGRFARWAEGRKSFRMEYFYREMRRETGLLMNNDRPEGGQWNFDSDNREPLPAGAPTPKRLRFLPDQITSDVLELVGERFCNHFGDLAEFGWAVTRRDALLALKHFLQECLAQFGTYQDAMRRGDPFLFHSMLSPYLNCGLLLPREVCLAAEQALRRGEVPLNAVEGFIRQILGWREYVRGIYWLRMPAYALSNALEAVRPLPEFYWSGETDLHCIKSVVEDTRRHGYAHHIQRLMVTGNFALLSGISPSEIEAWYLAVYIDAFDWVELPNTHGMVMFADGGLLASKTYAASGAYINRMSDYCAGCAYSVSMKSGPTACPFNYLYWNFLIENRARLRGNPRLAMPYRTLERMGPAREGEIQQQAREFLEGLSIQQEQRRGPRQGLLDF